MIDDSLRLTPMFPLGTVLFPGAALQLQIFETRYTKMLADVLDGDEQFGVVLIERGHEVGGGETRSDLGTMAVVTGCRRFDDGRAVVGAVGCERFQVERWLDDSPYPRALVTVRADLLETGPATLGVEAVRQQMKELYEAVHRVSPHVKVPEEIDQIDRIGGSTLAGGAAVISGVARSVWALAQLMPVSEFDRQRILAADSDADRLQIMSQSLSELALDLQMLGKLG